MSLESNSSPKLQRQASIPLRQFVRRSTMPIEDDDIIEGESKIYRNPDCLTGPLIGSPDPDLSTVQDLIKRNLMEEPDKPYLFYRPKLPDGTFKKEYVPMTHKEIQLTIQKLGTTLIKNDFVPPKEEYQDYKIPMVGIYGRNCPEWI